MPAYTHFQLIVLETPTNLPTNPSKMWEHDYVATAAELLNKDDVKDLSKDAWSRLNWFMGALRDALAQKSVEQNDPKVLKIFIAPEFFLRPEKENDPNTRPKERFYPFAEALAIEKVLLKLFSDKDLTDWLIIPGTMVFGNDTDNVETPNRIYVYKGGQEAKLLSSYAKVNWSNVDDIPLEAHLWNLPNLAQDGDNEKDEKNDKKPPSQLKRNKSAKDNTKHDVTAWGKAKIIFTVDPFTFGIEICIDHVAQILRSACEVYRRKNKVVQPLDMHILVACGRTIDTSNLAARDKGYVLRAEGSPENLCLPHSQLAVLDVVDSNLFTVAPWSESGSWHIHDVQQNVTEVVRQYQPETSKDYQECLRIYPAIAPEKGNAPL